MLACQANQGALFMVSERDIVRLMRTPGEGQGLAASLLRRADLECTDNARDFLEQITAQDADEPLSHRQSEWLIAIRDGNLWTSTVGDGFSVRLLLARVWECRLDLGEDEEAWIGGLVEAGASSIRRRDGGRLLGLARRLGLVADDEDE
jgi:hypothetical protein